MTHRACAICRHVDNDHYADICIDRDRGEALDASYCEACEGEHPEYAAHRFRQRGCEHKALLLGALRTSDTALRKMLDEHNPLGQHENGEIEYCALPGCAEAVRTLDIIRAAIKAAGDPPRHVRSCQWLAADGSCCDPLLAQTVEGDDD